MTEHTSQPRKQISDIKKSGTPIACLTAYTADIARIVDAHVDIILVGDSLGMVLYGYPDTLSVTLDMMIEHGKAVMRSTSRAIVTVDMPAHTYESSPEMALKNATRIMKETGCQAVKLEGGSEMAATIKTLVSNGIPVMGHIGLLPQSIEKIGGFKIQGRDEASAKKLIDDAKAISEAGVFCFVIEGTVEPVAKAITAAASAPSIGIGASAACDGQILVITDVLGLTPKPPRFSKAFASLTPIIDEAVKTYVNDVRSRKFPGPENTFPTK